MYITITLTFKPETQNRTDLLITTINILLIEIVCLNYHEYSLRNYFQRYQYIDDRREETRMMTRGTSEKGVFYAK